MRQSNQNNTERHHERASGYEIHNKSDVRVCVCVCMFLVYDRTDGRFK